MIILHVLSEEVAVDDLSVQLALAFGGDIPVKEEPMDGDNTGGESGGRGDKGDTPVQSEGQSDRVDTPTGSGAKKKRVLTRRESLLFLPVFLFVLQVGPDYGSICIGGKLVQD